ncbi:uncharacterized protein LOC108104209 [Drosophila eugracilis]|uniref:uncharacterized protein LOC108104209 n=1 Tax=Drosophila eugracilis TaxID=29029 RepID=UPI0007E7B99F|nr:uncharacterized protein LOC108104209 [Drosophila eugracilis]
MCSKLVLLFVLLFAVEKISSKFEFTNINCTSLDNNFDAFEYCHLKSVNRSYKYLSVKVNLFKKPITKIKTFSKFEFTNINCTSLDKDFDDFETCHLKSVNRSYKYVSIKVNLFKTPITKVKIRGILYKRFNGYKPFMFNVTVDACRYLKNPKSNSVVHYFLEFLRPYSNMIHSCPFDHDLIVDKLTVSFVNHQMTKVLPFPEGDYLLETHWIAYDIDRAVVRVYGTLS